jgi:DNA polymerase V
MVAWWDGGFKVKDPENFQIWGTVIHLIRTFEKV